MCLQARIPLLDHEPFLGCTCDELCYALLAIDVAARCFCLYQELAMIVQRHPLGISLLLICLQNLGPAATATFPNLGARP